LNLSELEPHFVIHTKRNEDKIDVYTELLSEATGIFFLCPVCFKKNNGPIGTHGIIVTFIGKDVPDDLGSHNKEGQPTRWNVSGTDYKDLTLTPSIDISRDSPGEWHGFITNGEVS
jgi:hypothetical protein